MIIIYNFNRYFLKKLVEKTSSILAGYVYLLNVYIYTIQLIFDFLALSFLDNNWYKIMIKTTPSFP